MTDRLHPLFRDILSGHGLTASCEPLHYRAEPDYDPQEAQEDAEEAACGQIWGCWYDLQSALEWHGIKFSEQTCRALTSQFPDAIVRSICVDLAPLVLAFVRETYAKSATTEGSEREARGEFGEDMG
jgi:hypothetical protein